MHFVTAFAGAATALMVAAAPAMALTITNKTSQEITIGLDMGDKESVHKIAGNGAITFKEECKEGCGVTGPWNHSWMAKTGEDFSFDGKGVVPGRTS